MKIQFSNGESKTVYPRYESKAFDSTTMIPIVVSFDGFGTSYPTSYKLQMQVGETWVDIGEVTRKMGKPNSIPLYKCPPAYIPLCISNYDELMNVSAFRGYMEQNWDDWKVTEVNPICHVWIEK